MSAVGEGGGTRKADDSTDKLGECDGDKGEGDGGQKFRKFCGCHLSMAPKVGDTSSLCRAR